MCSVTDLVCSCSFICKKKKAYIVAAQCRTVPIKHSGRIVRYPGVLK